MQKHVYLITDGVRSATTNNKRRAIRLGKTVEGGKVYSMPHWLYVEPSGAIYGWDTPTFVEQADLIFEDGALVA